MQAEGTQQSLESILRKEVHCSERLLACLDAERSALTQRDMACLETTTQEKLQYTQELENLERQREALVSGLGFSNDNPGLQRCFRSFADSELLSDLWRRILTNIENAREGNLANGGILESSRQHAEQALRILRGQSGAASVYSPAGGTEANLGQRDLGKV